MRKAWLLILALTLTACGIKIPPCLLDGTCNPSPVPSPAASPSPSPEPSASPVPVPSASPSAAPSPSPSPDHCPQPADIKLGFRPDARKLALGYRNMADITPIDADGKASPVDCGPTFDSRYGEPQAYQTGTGFTQDPVERASNTLGFVLVMASNDPSLWESGHYAQAGPMTVCVSYPFLNHWRCQDGTMGGDGLMTGFGQNNRGYNLPK